LNRLCYLNVECLLRDTQFFFMYIPLIVLSEISEHFLCLNLAWFCELYVTFQLIEELNYEGLISDIDGGKLILHSKQSKFPLCEIFTLPSPRVLDSSSSGYVHWYVPSNANCNLESSTSESGLLPSLITELNILIFCSSFIGIFFVIATQIPQNIGVDVVNLNNLIPYYYRFNIQVYLS